RNLPRVFPELAAPMLQTFDTSSDFLYRFLDPKLWFKSDGSVVKLTFAGAHFTGAPIVAVSDADMMFELLDDTRFPKVPESYALLGELIGNGLVVSKGQLWKQQRKLMTPFFHFKSLKLSIRVMEKKAKLMVDALLAEGGTPVESIDFFAKIAGRVIAEIAF